MKAIFRFTVVLAIIAALIMTFAACTKDNAPETEPTKKSENSTAAKSTQAPKGTPTPVPTPAPVKYTLRVGLAGDGSDELIEYDDSDTEAMFSVYPAAYHITLKKDGETVSLPSSISVVENTEVTLSLSVEENGMYEFEGWIGDVESTEREIKVKVTKDMTVSVNMKQVLTANIAQDAQCKLDNDYNTPPTWIAKHATDGKIYINGFTTNILQCAEPSEDYNPLDTPSNITIDLGEAKDFDVITLFPRPIEEVATANTEGNACFPVGMIIQVSADGETYTDVKTIVDQPNPFDKAKSYDLGAQNARYIRISVTHVTDPASDEGDPMASFRVQLYEIMVFDK